jgi:type I restriction enzyme S subunit
MKKYDLYKDSGVNWIGEIPSHWETTPFSHFFQIRKDIAGKEGYDVLSVTQTGIKVKDIEHNEGQIALDYSKYQFADPGDFIMNHMDLITGYIGRAESLGVTSPDYRVFRAFNKDAYEDYYLLVFQLCYKWKVFFALGQGVANKGRWRLPANQLKKFQIPVPPLKEQERITNFLKNKNKEIDGLIVNIEHEIELLKEYKQSAIARVVFHGLNPDAPMKESGVSWMGSVPAHWEIKRLASAFTENRTSNSDLSYTDAYKFNYGALVRKDEDTSITEDVLEIYKKYTVIKPNDILINGLNLNYDFVSQRVAISYDSGIITSAYLAITPRENINPTYYCYLLKSMDAKKLFHGMGTGIRLTLSFAELKKQLILFPPIEEQDDIVKYINYKTTEIDRLVVELTYQVEYLKEYKQRLIADVVTGKINVQ